MNETMWCTQAYIQQIYGIQHTSHSSARTASTQQPALKSYYNLGIWLVKSRLNDNSNYFQKQYHSHHSHKVNPRMSLLHRRKKNNKCIYSFLFFLVKWSLKYIVTVNTDYKSNTSSKYIHQWKQKANVAFCYHRTILVRSGHQWRYPVINMLNENIKKSMIYCNRFSQMNK